MHREARLPEYHSPSARSRLKKRQDSGNDPIPAGPTSGKVAIFITCYGNHNHPRMVEDLAAVLRHNGVAVKLLARESCCGMPKLELGDLDTADPDRRRERRLGPPIPSCVLMFKQELPLMFPDDADLRKVKRAFFDPFEYLMQRNAAGLFNTDFRNGLGKVAWQVACHQRVQNIGPKTREALNLVPGTEVITIERCSGHDGTYGVKKASYDLARKIAKPVESRVRQAQPDHFTSDCIMAGAHLAHGLGDGVEAEHPITLIRIAYGI